jgi:hypothetical protein
MSGNTDGHGYLKKKLGLRISSHYFCEFKLPLIKSCSLAIAYACLPIPLPHRHHRALCSQRWHQQTARPHNAIHVVCGCEAGWTYCQILLRWRRLMVEKLTFNSLAATLVDIPAVSMPIACSFKTWDIGDIVLCDKTAHFSVDFYCPKGHLCNVNAV